jgi:hypothetical protein
MGGLTEHAASPFLLGSCAVCFAKGERSMKKQTFMAALTIVALILVASAAFIVQTR